MYELFAMVPEACANTQKIADQCNFDFDFGHTKIPYYKAPNGMDNQEFFEKLCWDGLERRFPGRVERRFFCCSETPKAAAQMETAAFGVGCFTNRKSGIFLLDALDG